MNSLLDYKRSMIILFIIILIILLIYSFNVSKYVIFQVNVYRFRWQYSQSTYTNFDPIRSKSKVSYTLYSIQSAMFVIRKFGLLSFLLNISFQIIYINIFLTLFFIFPLQFFKHYTNFL